MSTRITERRIGDVTVLQVAGRVILGDGAAELRSRMNDLILGAGHLTINRFFALDGRTYEAGALGVKTKEMLGLVSSLVLRCDDCVTYHVIRCHEAGVTREEFLEIFSVGLVVGGSIVIPHLRRAMVRLEELTT